MNDDEAAEATRGRLDQPRNTRESAHLRRLDALGLLPVGICPDCRQAIIRCEPTWTADEAIRHHQSSTNACDARIAAHLVTAHINAARPTAAIATMQYFNLKIEANEATSPERHRLRNRITEGIPGFEETTWTMVYDLFGSANESKEEFEAEVGPPRKPPANHYGMELLMGVSVASGQMQASRAGL